MPAAHEPFHCSVCFIATSPYPAAAAGIFEYSVEIDLRLGKYLARVVIL